MKRVFSFPRTAVLTAAASLAIALVITAPADAAPIRFDNPAGPGHFDWNGTSGQNFLDITLDATSQPGSSGAVGTFRRRDFVNGTEIRGATSASQVQYSTLDGGSAGPGFFLAGVDLLSPIPSPVPVEGFRVSGFIFRSNADPGFPEFNLIEGDEKFLGVQFDLGSGIQYGWIGLVRTGQEVDAFAWGYETEPGVPIAAGVPEPGTWSLLILGSTALLRRRKRRAGK